MHSVRLAAGNRTAASSSTLNKGLEKIQAARGYDLAPIFALSSDWEEKFLISSMAHCTAEAFNSVRCFDHSGRLDDSPQDKKQKAATALLRDRLHEQDFAGPISTRASRILGPISRFRFAEILPHIQLALPLVLGLLLVFC